MISIILGLTASMLLSSAFMRTIKSKCQPALSLSTVKPEVGRLEKDVLSLSGETSLASEREHCYPQSGTKIPTV